MSCCFVVVTVAIFPMMMQAADPALAVKRVMKDLSCESEGNMLHSLLEHVVVHS